MSSGESANSELQYGNPNQYWLSYINTTSYLDSLYSELSQMNPPSNSSSVSQKELNDIRVYVDNLIEDTSTAARYKIYDANLFGFIKNVLSGSGIEFSEVSNIVDSIKEDTTPLLAKLKQRFNRVRPAQLSFYYELGMFPFKSVSADSASYPSGHCFYSKVICEVLGLRYPRHFKQLNELSDDICASRLAMGLNYISDIDFALFVADKVLSHPDFKKKYKI